MKKQQKHFVVCGALIVALLTAVMPLRSSAQQGAGILQGKVVDEASVPIAGASVVVKGSVKGVSTSADGNFTLSGLTDGDVLEISFLGYGTQEVAYHGQTFIDVTLHEQSLKGEEVVVTALGIKRSEKALSYNVQKVGGDELTTVKDANFMNSLAGKVAGVQINSSAAGAGAAARVILRGTKSLTKDDNALYVIDGVPMFTVYSGDTGGGTMNNQPGTNSVADLNPEDIESLSVLTGPSAAALYGSNAANGVILITTKKGAEGTTHVTYSNSTSFSNPLLMPRFQDTYGNATGSSQSWGEKLATPTGYNPADFFNTGVQEINSITLTTGNDRNQFYASVSTTNTTGILPNSDYNRYNFTFRTTNRFARDKLTLDASAQYITQDNKNMVGSGQYFNPLPALYLFPRGESFEEVQMYERYNETRHISEQFWDQKFAGDFNMQNPYWIMHRMLNELQKRRYIINASLRWDITDWLNIVGRVHMDNSDQDAYAKRYASTSTLFTEGSSRGYYGHSKQNDRAVYADALLSINKTFIDDRLSLNFNLGTSINDQVEDATYLNGGLNKLPNFFAYSNINLSTSKRGESAWHDQTQSIFGNLELGWDHWLYLTATGRNDWASQLAFTDKLSYFYPSVGLSVVFNELFELPKEISLLKLRGSWAEVASAPSRYLTQMQFAYNDQYDQYEYPKQHYDTNLRPENTRSWEIGLNVRFFDSKLYSDATYYRSNTFNQTFTVPASASSGYESNIVQTGNIQNEGIELTAGYNNEWGKFGFSTGITYTYNKNKVVNLANGALNPVTGESIDMPYMDATSCLGIEGGPVIRLTEGGTMGDLYVLNRQLRRDDHGFLWGDDKGSIDLVDNGEYTRIGSILPKYNLGWTGMLSYAGVQLGWTVAARVGGWVVSDTQAILDRYGVSEATAKARDNGLIYFGDRGVTPENYYTTISKAPASFYMYDATNIRLADMSLSYSIPRKWFRNKVGMTVAFTAKNLWLIYCKAPFDPESTSAVANNFYQAVDYFQMPSLRQLGFSVKLAI